MFIDVYSTIGPGEDFNTNKKSSCIHKNIWLFHVISSTVFIGMNAP